MYLKKKKRLTWVFNTTFNNIFLSIKKESITKRSSCLYVRLRKDHTWPLCKLKPTTVYNSNDIIRSL